MEPRDPIATVEGMRKHLMNGHNADLAPEYMHPEIKVARTGMTGAVRYLEKIGISTASGETFESISDPITKFQVGFREVIAAFPDMHHELVAPAMQDGDMTILRIRFLATHQGPFRGLPATNRKIDFNEVVFQRVTDGLVSEVWAFGDELELLQQLGVLGATSPSEA